VCDKNPDCFGHQDEDADQCKKSNPCEIDNGGCYHTCKNTYGGNYFCDCNPGFKLRADNKTCEDIDECEIPGICSHYCVNTKGSFKCSCQEGYFIDPKFPHFCKANGESPFLVLANRHDVRSLHFDRNHFRSLVLSTRSAIALDFDYKSKTLYYSDVAKEQILSVNMSDAPVQSSDSKVQVVVKDYVSTPDGLAFDWVHRNLYWTDTGKNSIEVINVDSGYRRTLLKEDMDEPRAIVVDPRDDQGWMYWSDWGTVPKIERAGLDGSRRQAIVTTDIEWPNGLTIDYVINRLFWVDAKGHVICSSDLNGEDRKIVLYSNNYLKHPFAITVFEDWVFWTDWETEGIHKANKFHGGNLTDVAQNLYSPMDLHVFHKYKQPLSTNHCQDAGCSHICLKTPHLSDSSASFTCACPDGMELKEDNLKICEGTPELKTTPSEKVIFLGNTGSKTTLTPYLKPHSPKDNSKNQDVGQIAGIVVGIILAVALIGALIGYLLYRSYMRRNIKSMNFDNPVYRKTTEDQFSLEKNQYQPSRTLPSTLEPLTAPSNELV
jgi:sugar lactone lactonase YvrE